MRLRVVIADPAGNITAFVKNEEIPFSQYQRIASQIMKLEQYHVEQVGFVKPPVHGGEARLEMMGGEFCGNASRSFGKYIADGKNVSEVVIEITGNPNLMKISCDMEKQTARAEMPLPLKLDQILNYPVIIFDGISHVIVEGKEPSEQLTDEILDHIKKQWNPEAAGIIYYDSEKECMTPVVWVRDVNSLVHENSCGSGSVAVASYLSWDRPDGTYQYSLKQPGGEIVVQIVKENGEITEAAIDGPVRISEEIELEVLV